MFRRVNRRAVIGGLEAKRNGEEFENLIKYNAKKSGVTITQIPSGCRWVNGVRAVAVPTDFDFIAWKDGRAMAFDAKSTNGNTFTKSMVKQHQAVKLYEIEQNSNSTAGYLVWFKAHNVIVFFTATQLYNLKPRTSLKVTDGLRVGAAPTFDIGSLLYAKRT